MNMPQAIKLLFSYANGAIFKKPIIIQPAGGQVYGIATDEESIAFIRIDDFSVDRPLAIDFESLKFTRKKIESFEFDGSKLYAIRPANKEPIAVELQPVSGTVQLPKLSHRSLVTVPFAQLLSAYRKTTINNIVDSVLIGKYFCQTGSSNTTMTHLGLSGREVLVGIRPFAHAIKLFERKAAENINLIRTPESLVMFDDEAIVIMPAREEHSIDPASIKHIATVKKEFFREDRNKIEFLRSVVFVNNAPFHAHHNYTFSKKLTKAQSQFVCKKLSEDINIGVWYGYTVVLHDGEVYIFVH
jgi:hypothetical protein